MDSNSKYVKDIQIRSKIRFFLGVLARLKNYLKNKYAVSVARRRGAIVGESVSMPLALAKKANSNLKIGNNTSIQTSKFDLRATINIGSYVIIGSGTEIITCSHNVDSPDWEFKSYGITIEDYVWVATNVLILPSCTKIEYGAVVGSGSVLAKNVETMNIVSGNTAVFIRKRKEVHYNLCVEGLLGNDLSFFIKVRNKNGYKCL
jgi:acetyltransferase-like isoleucine patch superfamily enzyme